MTPEQRAAAVLRAAAEANLCDGYTRTEAAAWHSLIAEALADALKEARDLCQFVPDRIRIGELLVGGTSGPAAPGMIECFVCGGLGRLGEVLCRACNGVGQIADSGDPPDPNPGTLALRPCGHAVDWIGDGAPAEFKVERQRLWALQGLTAKHVTDFRGIHQLLTDGAGCHCEPRATPREAVGAPDVVGP